MAFKATITVMTELYINNDYDQGCDPDTTSDCGVVDTIIKPDLEQLVKELKAQYSDIEYFEENRYETGYDHEERDGTKVNNMVSIYITEVEENDINHEQIAVVSELLKVE